ncbi:MAG: hypothetical protein ACM65K_21175 [Microcoleus sp.]|uniref:hypothetical protein n=1 Tax=Microcoleus sp. CAWBG640 TaxID=2841653 RepID=UPI00312B67B6
MQNTINFISKCRQMLVSRLNWFLTTYFKMFLVAIGTKIQLNKTAGVSPSTDRGERREECA